MATTDLRLLLLASLSGGLMVGCTTAASPPQQTPTSTVAVQEARALVTPIPPPTTATPVPFTPDVTQRHSAGVPLPFAPGARNVVVTYTPAPAGGALVKSGFAMVSVGDNYFYPDEVHVTVGTTLLWT